MPSSASVAEDVCLSLSASARALAQLCALFAPGALAAAPLERLLRDASLAPLSLPPAGDLAAGVAELEAAGLAQRDATGAVSVVPAAALALMRLARTQGVLLPLLDAVERDWLADGPRMRSGEEP